MSYPLVKWIKWDYEQNVQVVSDAILECIVRQSVANRSYKHGLQITNKYWQKRIEIVYCAVQKKTKYVIGNVRHNCEKEQIQIQNQSLFSVSIFEVEIDPSLASLSGTFSSRGRSRSTRPRWLFVQMSSPFRGNDNRLWVIDTHREICALGVGDCQAPWIMNFSTWNNMIHMK